MKLLAAIVILIQFTSDAVAKQPLAHKPINREQLINKEWIGPGGEYLYIVNDTVLFQTHGDHDKTTFSISDNLLVLTRYSDGTSGPHSYNDTFIVDRLNDDTLIIKSFKNRYSAPGVYYSGPHDPLRAGAPVIFVNRIILNDPSLRFQKIFFSSHGGLGAGMCMGSEESIDSAGNVFFAIGPGKCGGYNGTYKGRLSADQLKQLCALVKESMPDRFDMGYSGIDGGMTTYRFYYNNKVKEVNGLGVPYLALDLQTFLNDLLGKIKTEKISGDFKLQQ